MSGHIAVVCNDSARYSMFWICLSDMHKPVNTRPIWEITSDRILGRNEAAREMLDKGGEWLLCLDDDHVFSTGLLNRLLSHNKPVVGALYLQRAKPFLPIAYSHKDEEGRYHNINLHNHGENDLIEVAAVGTGGMLIRAEVFRKLSWPWFEHGRASEDLIFCDKVYEEGLGPVYCDLGARLGHIAPAALWPAFQDDKWAAGFALADGFSVTVDLPDEESV